VTPGTCATCHNGTTATGKPAGHFVTTRACDACHSTTRWIPATTYSHTSPLYRPHQASVTCVQCHASKTETATWPYGAYKPECAGCHANRFKLNSHKKNESPETYYTVSELANCAGSCHLYRGTAIKELRPSRHRSTSGAF